MDFSKKDNKSEKLGLGFINQSEIGTKIFLPDWWNR